MRRLMYFTIGFGVACLAGAALYGQWFLLGAAGAMLLAGVLYFLSGKSDIWKRPALIAVGCAIGLGWFGLYDGIFVLIPRAMDGETAAIIIEASDYSMPTDYGSSVEGTVNLMGRDYNVKAYLNSTTQVKPGDRVNGTFRFRVTTDGGLDDPTSHRTEGIFLLAYPKSEVKIEKCEETPVKYYPAIWREQLLRRIDALMPETGAAFARALLLGDRSGIDYQLNTAFKVTGISHVIAVSGMHVSILFGLLSVLTVKRRLLSCLIGVPVIMLFAAIVGFTPSITRACIMQSLILIASATNREYDQGTSLAFAVLVMLVWNPLTVLSVSFQLSVACMAGIFLFSKSIQQRLAGEKGRYAAKRDSLIGRLRNGLATTVAISLSATIVTTPLVAYYFGCVSVIGIITNVLTLWIISLIFYGILVCLAISLVNMTVAGWLGWLLSLPVQLVILITEMLAKVPMSTVYTVSPYVTAWLIGIYTMLAVFFFQRRKRIFLMILCMAITLMLSQILSWMEPLRDDLRVTVLDVGQGQCIILQSEGKTFLVDCGGDNPEEADVAAETLLSQGISRLDGIFLTHYDEDHAGGLPYLLTRISADILFVPQIEGGEDLHAALAECHDGEMVYVREDLQYTLGCAKITIVGPFSRESGNESGLCILFQRENCDILITGDRGELGELMLLLGRTLPDLELLVVGHHGSATSTGEKLLAATTPEIAVISVGRENRYGHPSDKVLKRLAEWGCTVYRTDINGTIIFRR